MLAKVLCNAKDSNYYSPPSKQVNAFVMMKLMFIPFTFGLSLPIRVKSMRDSRGPWTLQDHRFSGRPNGIDRAPASTTEDFDDDPGQSAKSGAGCSCRFAIVMTYHLSHMIITIYNICGDIWWYLALSISRTDPICDHRPKIWRCWSWMPE